MNAAYLSSYRCLDNIFRKKSFSGIELNSTLNAVDPKDKPLVTKIVYGVLDKNIELEYKIGLFAKKVKPSVMPVLKIGLYSLLYLSTPQFAAVNECVDLVKAIGKKELSGFINATMRRLAAAEGEFPLPKDRDENLSVKYSFPLWCVKKLVAEKGADFTEKFLSYEPPRRTHIRVNTDLISVADFRKLLDKQKIQYENSPLPDAFYVCGKLNVNSKFFTPMSLGSMLAARAVDPKGNCAVLDVCAAPGGKSVYMAQLNKNARVTACDLYPHRAELIESYVKRFRINNVQVKTQDGTVFNPDFSEKFDYVLCDAPCSGMGVFYDKPDIKLFREEKSLSELSALQKSILLNASKYVRRGGTLLYSTCTLFDKENGQVARYLQENNPEFVFDKIVLPVFGEYAGEKHFYPHIDNVEGYYIAKFKRK